MFWKLSRFHQILHSDDPVQNLKNWPFRRFENSVPYGMVHTIGSISSTVVFLDRLVSSLTVHFRTLNTKNGPLLLYFQKSLFWKNQNWDSLDWRKIWHLGFNFETLELSKLSVLNISDFKSFKSIIWLFNSLLSG